VAFGKPCGSGIPLVLLLKLVERGDNMRDVSQEIAAVHKACPASPRDHAPIAVAGMNIDGGTRGNSCDPAVVNPGTMPHVHMSRRSRHAAFSQLNSRYEEKDGSDQNLAAQE